jgi:hypothetical protein
MLSDSYQVAIGKCLAIRSYTPDGNDLAVHRLFWRCQDMAKILNSDSYQVAIRKLPPDSKMRRVIAERRR